MKFLKLIRWPNLFIIAFTMYTIRFFLVRAILQSAYLDLLFTQQQFFALVLSTLFIAAGGYIINDYFDLAIDRINKPDKVFIGNIITTQQALVLHTILSLVGIAIALVLGIKVGVYKLAVIQAITVGLLWFYSSEFKRQFLIGNLVIALLSGLVPLIVVAFEMPLLIANFKTIIIENEDAFMLNKNIPLAMLQNLHTVWIFVISFAAFAFLLTLIREIIKDTEDYVGDEAYGCRTIPVKLGVANTKKIIIGLCILVVTLLGILQYKQFIVKDYFSMIYTIVFVTLPLLILCYLILNANTKKHFSKASIFSKIIMVLGVGYCFVFYWLMR